MVRFEDLKGYLLEFRRVFRITKKPSREEFSIIVKVTGIGTLIIGFIGFVIQMVYRALI